MLYKVGQGNHARRNVSRYRGVVTKRIAVITALALLLSGLHLGPWSPTRVSKADVIGTTTLIRVSESESSQQGTVESGGARVSGDGTHVAFESRSGNLVANDTNSDTDVFLKNIETGGLELITVALDGNSGDEGGWGASVSRDGRYVAFQSNSTNLTDIQGSGTQIYLRDRLLDQTVLVSATAGGNPGNGSSESPSISGDGRYVAFHSQANNLVEGDAFDTERGVYVWDRASGSSTSYPRLRARRIPEMVRAFHQLFRRMVRVLSSPRKQVILLLMTQTLQWTYLWYPDREVLQKGSQ